jgi:hypothetical protein
MNKPLIVAAVFGIPALLILLAKPFQAWGDSIKPGLGELMNGGIGLALLILAAIAALITRKLG